MPWYSPILCVGWNLPSYSVTWAFLNWSQTPPLDLVVMAAIFSRSTSCPCVTQSWNAAFLSFIPLLFHRRLSSFTPAGPNLTSLLLSWTFLLQLLASSLLFPNSSLCTIKCRHVGSCLAQQCKHFSRSSCSSNWGPFCVPCPSSPLAATVPSPCFAPSA